MEKLLKNSFNSLKYLLISVFLFSCSAANQVQKTEKIQSVSISTYGGQMGYHQSLKLTADTLYYDIGSRLDTLGNKIIKKLNTQYKLEDIIATNQLDNFSKITSGKSRLPVDGSDTAITIKTDSAEFKVINGNGDLVAVIVANLNAIIEKEFKKTK